MNGVLAPVAVGENDRAKGRGGQPRIFLAGVLILGALAYLVLASLPQGTIYYQTVSELKQRVSDPEPVRVAGLVADGSIKREAIDGAGSERTGSTGSAEGASSARLLFEVKDGNHRLPVAYNGVVPDIFGPNIEVVVEGKRDESGVFQAQTLLAKCPSRFESAIPTPGGGTIQ